MTAQKLLHDWFENVWNRKDDDFVHAHLAKTCEVHGLGPRQTWSADDFLDFRNRLLGTIAGLRVEVLDSMQQDDRTLGLARVTGTVNGSPVDFELGYWARVNSEDRIFEARNVVDFLSLLVQSGTVKADVVAELLGS